MIKQIIKKLDKNNEKIFGVLAIILIILFAISLSPKTLQNDTFYTVTIGKLITENGIDMQDHFSWNELPYTYPHWLYDVGMHFIYNIGGWNSIYISTCIFTSILGICIYFSNTRLNDNKLISFIVTIAVMYLLKGYIAARAQLVTFILFILLVYNIERFIKNKNIINALALFVIHTLIANLHVAVWPFSFVLYLPYVAEYLIAEIADIVLYKKYQKVFLKLRARVIHKKLEKTDSNKEMLEQKLQKINDKLELLDVREQKVKAKREEKKPYKVEINKNKNVRWLILIMIIAVLTGLLTPLGNVPYTYTYNTMIGNTMKSINEHLPLTLINNTQMLCTIIVILALITFSNVKIKLADLFMLGGLCYLMFSTRRQQSMFVLIGSIAFTRLAIQFFENITKKSSKEISKKYINIFTIFVLTVVVASLSVHFYKKIKDDDYINKKTYPVEASEWILNNLDVNKIRIYNEYNYGSYLLYKGIPVFIDSRADLYAPEFNTPTGNKEDGKDIFSDFINSSNIGTYYGDIFEKYDITHVILYKNSKINMLITKADSEKFEELYSDDNFVIYEVVK